MVSNHGHTERPRPWRISRKLLLTVGCLTLAWGVILAWNSPAAGYEVSMYEATPLSAWMAIAGGLFSGLVVAAIHPRDDLAGLGVALSGVATLVIVGLPVIRNYFYMGTADALTHLGWTEEFRIGTLGPLDLLYPGGHLIAGVIGETLFLESHRAVLLTTVVLTGLYLLFVPLVVRALVGATSAGVIAAYAAIFLLPFNNVSTSLNFHSYSYTLALIPLFLYVLVRLMLSGRSEDGSTDVMQWNALVIWIGLGILLAHPQVKLNVVVLLGAFVVLAVVVRRWYPDSTLGELRPVYGSFLLLTGAWAVWTIQHWQFEAAIENVYLSAYNTFLGDETVGQTATEAGVSATMIGGSLWELFAKLFLVQSVFVVLALGALVVALARTADRTSRPDYSVVTYVGVSGVFLAPIFFVHFLGDVSQYFFRHLGFGMVLATILGSLALFYLAGGLTGPSTGGALRTVGVWVCCIALVLSLLTVFPSPYLYLPSGHVTHAEADGYEIAIDTAEPTTEWSGIRTGPGRFYDGLTPGLRPITATGSSTDGDAELANVTGGEIDEPMYLPISTRDHDREVTAYLEFRYSNESFAAVHDQRTVNHVHTNGDFELYYLVPAAD